MAVAGEGSRFRSLQAMAVAVSAVRRPGRGRQAAPSALPGLAPAPLAAARSLHAFTLPDGPAPIRSCSAAPFADVLSAHPGSLHAFSAWECRLQPPASTAFLNFILILLIVRACAFRRRGATPDKETCRRGGSAIRSAERRVRARASRMDAARGGAEQERIATGPSGQSDK